MASHPSGTDHWACSATPDRIVCQSGDAATDQSSLSVSSLPRTIHQSLREAHVLNTFHLARDTAFCCGDVRRQLYRRLLEQLDILPRDHYERSFCLRSRKPYVLGSLIAFSSFVRCSVRADIRSEQPTASETVDTSSDQWERLEWSSRFH